MKKHFKWIAVILLVACVFTFVGCPKEPELPIDNPPTVNGGDNGSNSGNNGDNGSNSGDNGNTGENGSTNNGSNVDDGNYKYKKSLWGKWTRIDNGEVYTISGNELRREYGWGDESFGSVYLESENVLVIGDGESAARLFRKSGGLTSFTAKVVGFQRTSRAASDLTQTGMSGVTVSRASSDISTDTDEVVSGADGTIVFDNVVAGETQKITVETESGKTIELEVTPSYDGENLGTIPIVESGYSFKTTYNVSRDWNSEYYLFGNNYTTYNLQLNFANIGDATCSTASYEFLTSDPNIQLSQSTGIISSIAAGSSKSINLEVSYGDLQEFYKDVTIAIKIVDSKEKRTWLDSITLRFYQTPVFLNFYTYNANQSGNLNGFIMCPDGRAEYFNAYHNNYSSKILPYNKDGNNDYKVVFSATSDYDEMAYAFNAKYNENSPYVDFNEIFKDSNKAFELIDSYEDGEGNNKEETAVIIEDPYCETMSYVQYGDIDYFNLNLDDVLYSRIEEIKIPKAGLSASGKEVVVATVKGKNFQSPLANVDFSCSSKYVVNKLNKNIFDDETMSVELQIPSVAKDYEVTAKTEWNELTEIFSVEDYDVVTGDYVLKDNRIVRKEYLSELTEKDRELIFGVISVSRTGVPYIVGLEYDSSLKWAPEGSIGYDTDFKEIQAYVECGNYDQTNGKYDYVFVGDLDGSDNWEEICKVDPEGTKDAATNYPVFNFALNYGETNGLTGTDFEEGWYVPSVAELSYVLEKQFILHDSLSVFGDRYVHLNYLNYFWTSSQSSYLRVYVVRSGGKVTTDDLSVKDTLNSVLVLHPFNSELFNNYDYPEPTVTSVEIPTAGAGYTGELPVTIIGENLKSYEITCSDGSFGNVTYVSNTKAIATIKCNGDVGTTNITVKSGSSSATGTVKVVEKAKCYTDAEIGKIVLEDGSLVTNEDYDSTTMKAIAVVCGTKYAGGQVIGVGLQSSSGQWAKDGTYGYNNNFTKIVSTPSDFGAGAADTATFTGDLDGSDNWAYICSLDPEGTKDAATNYSAFYFANTYGITQGISGNYKDGWYIPSLKELCDIYKIKDTISDVITTVGGNLIMSYWYWSSSQYASGSNYAYPVDFSSGNVDYDCWNKSYNLNVIVIQSFNAE